MSTSETVAHQPSGCLLYVLIEMRRRELLRRFEITVDMCELVLMRLVSNGEMLISSLA